MNCSNCYSRFEFKSAMKWAQSLFFALWFSLAFLISFISGNWIVIGVLIIGIPFGIELLFLKYGPLNLVGRKALNS